LRFLPTRLFGTPTRVNGRCAWRDYRGVFSKARSQRRIWPRQTAHKHAKREGPLPLAIAGMLELTLRPGQANADREDYDFSLGTPDFSPVSGLVAVLPETAICE